KRLFQQTLVTESPKRQRLAWVDYAKGFGIFLVVLGHTIRALINSSILEKSTIFKFVDEWIYAFHMPLFFFLSGLFVCRAASKPLRDFIVSRLNIIIYPYLVWSILQSLLQSMGSGYTNNQTSLIELWKIIYQPVMQFWFLYTLFILVLIYTILQKRGVSPMGFLIFSIFIYAIYVFGINFSFWGVLYSAQRYAIYLAIGAVFGSGKLMSSLSKIKTQIWLIILIGGFLAVALGVSFNLLTGGLTRFLVALFGISASVALAIILERLGKTPFVKEWGCLSLEIYLAHVIAAAIFRILLQKVLGITEPIAHLFLGTMVGIYLPIALNIICQRIGFRYMFRLV
ncbi:MAG TPA: acyltransferase, partial [Cyanobacteria bacterium UBA11149]|nr:acyltransferase [Cyanobacteria bacterium UBA11149]